MLNIKTLYQYKRRHDNTGDGGQEGAYQISSNESNKFRSQRSGRASNSKEPSLPQPPRQYLL